jgi:hypothetical protein
MPASRRSATIDSRRNLNMLGNSLKKSIESFGDGVCAIGYGSNGRRTKALRFGNVKLLELV